MSGTDQTWLITGGAGFIGANLVRRVLEARPGVRVINLDALTYAGNPDNLAGLDAEPRYEFVHADIRDERAVRPAVERADVVIHLAAESHVDRSIADARAFVSTNVVGTQTLLDLARQCSGARRFVHVSTDEVYGCLPLDRPELRFGEDDPVRPRSPYAASKAAGEMLVRAAHTTHGQDVVIARPSNNMGPYQLPEKLIPRCIAELMRGEAAPLYGDGLHVRDWIHVTDTCDALITLVERGVSGEAYNIGAHNERSNLELVRTLIRAMGKDESMIRHIEDRPGHDRRYAVSTEKIRSLGWSATRSSWPGALEETLAWYQRNSAWLERALRSL